MKISIELDCPSWMRKAAQALLPIAAIAIAGVALAVPKTFASNETLSAADLNADFDDLETRVATMETSLSRVSVGNTAPFTINSGAYLKVPYSNVLFDDKGEFDPVAQRFTAAAAGDYEICASLTFANVNVPAELYVYVNGVREKAIGGPRDDTPHGCRTVRLAAGGYVEVWVRESSGSTVNVTSDVSWDWLTVVQLRR